MTPKLLNFNDRGVIMGAPKDEHTKVPKSESEVEAYLAKLQYALQDKYTLIDFVKDRYADRNRSIVFTNAYTIAELFPDDPPEKVLREELACLKVQDYIETVKDKNFPKRSALWVFGKRYNGRDVYIKFRVEIIQRNHILVLSFHFSTIPFTEMFFPFAE